MPAGSQERRQSQADRKRLHRIEAAALGLLLLRRRQTIETNQPEAALIHVVASSVLTMRQAARAFGRDTITSRFAGLPPWPDETTRFVDATRAHQIARSHLVRVQAEVQKARVANDADPWTTALRETEYRAKTIAVTETAAAASEERLDAARDAAVALGIELLKEWNAEGEACPECIAMDGETVPLDSVFSNGLEPGSAHPNCNCWPEILTKS